MPALPPVTIKTLPLKSGMSVFGSNLFLLVTMLANDDTSAMRDSTMTSKGGVYFSETVWHLRQTFTAAGDCTSKVVTSRPYNDIYIGHVQR